MNKISINNKYNSCSKLCIFKIIINLVLRIFIAKFKNDAKKRENGPQGVNVKVVISLKKFATSKSNTMGLHYRKHWFFSKIV